ncbi:MAG: QcrA and Rieske domain-containing protein [Bdellovibrionota bacterium]
MSCEKDCPSRRQFIKEGVAALAGLAVFGAACGSGTGGTTPGTSVTTDASNIATFPFSAYPNLQTAGGSYYVKVTAASGTKNVYVTRVSTAAVVALNSTCTHQSCAVGTYSASAQTYSCPCHGSVFSSTGAVINGPATTGLTSYSATIGASSITATIP